MILFFTKGILEKTNSYVQKEYTMAARFFHRKIYVVMLDTIRDEDVPTEKIPWWIDIQEKQCIEGTEDIAKLAETISAALGVQTHADKMNRIVALYNELYRSGRTTEAEKCLAEYLHGSSIQGKAALIANIVRNGVQSASLGSPAKSVKRLDKPLYSHMKKPWYSFYECLQLEIHDSLFTFGNGFIFHRGNHGDAHVIWIWRDNELIHTIGGLIEAWKLQVFYDSLDDTVYVTYETDVEVMTNGTERVDTMLGVTIIEDPAGNARCTNFRF